MANTTTECPYCGFPVDTGGCTHCSRQELAEPGLMTPAEAMSQAMICVNRVAAGRGYSNCVQLDVAALEAACCLRAARLLMWTVVETSVQEVSNG